MKDIVTYNKLDLYCYEELALKYTIEKLELDCLSSRNVEEVAEKYSLISKLTKKIDLLNSANNERLNFSTYHDL